MNSFAASVCSSTEMNDISILVKQDSQATDENEPCGLRILEDFHKLYEGCIKKIDQESGAESDRICVSSISQISQSLLFLHWHFHLAM